MEGLAIRIEKTPWDKSYLRIDLDNESRIIEIRDFVNSIPGVENVNIAQNQSQTSQHLIVYSKHSCSIEKLRERVEKALMVYSDDKNIFKGEHVQSVESFIRKYPEVYALYNSAKEKYNQGIYNRNVLDDLRLALELLMKAVLKNNKPLEKQKDDLGSYLKGQGSAVEVRNLFEKVLDYYTLYQNHNVKHNENINSVDMQTIVDLTMVMIKRLQSMEDLSRGKNSEPAI